MPDSSAIDAAVLERLNTDSTLVGLLGGGFWFDSAPANKKRFGILSLADSVDASRFAGRSHEESLYMCKAVVLTTEPNADSTARQAAARIDALLEGAIFAVDGYGFMSSMREDRIRYTEVDDVDPVIRYLHRGGHYRVVMSVNP